MSGLSRSTCISLCRCRKSDDPKDLSVKACFQHCHTPHSNKNHVPFIRPVIIYMNWVNPETERSSSNAQTYCHLCEVTLWIHGSLSHCYLGRDVDASWLFNITIILILSKGTLGARVSEFWCKDHIPGLPMAQGTEEACWGSLNAKLLEVRLFMQLPRNSSAAWNIGVNLVNCYPIFCNFVTSEISGTYWIPCESPIHLPILTQQESTADSFIGRPWSKANDMGVDYISHTWLNDKSYKWTSLSSWHSHDPVQYSRHEPLQIEFRWLQGGALISNKSQQRCQDEVHMNTLRVHSVHKNDWTWHANIILSYSLFVFASHLSLLMEWVSIYIAVNKLFCLY